MSSAGYGGLTIVTNTHEEKRLAFEALAALIERINDPQPNVVAIRGER